MAEHTRHSIDANRRPDADAAGKHIGTHPPPHRRVFAISAAILVLAGAILVIGVIPAVETDTYPRADPVRAARAFQVNVGISLLAAVALLLGGVPLMRKGRGGRSLLTLLGVVVLVAGLALVDATGAFGSHGPHMRVARVFMGLGAAAELSAGVLTCVAALRSTEKPSTGTLQSDSTG